MIGNLQIKNKYNIECDMDTITNEADQHQSSNR